MKLKYNKKLIKNLLTSVSTLALITGGATEAQAVDITGDNFMLFASGGTTTGTNATGAVFAGMSINYLGNYTGKSGDLIHYMYNIDAGTYTPGILSFINSAGTGGTSGSFNNITNTGKVTNLPIELYSGSSITLGSGGDFSGLASINGMGASPAGTVYILTNTYNGSIGQTQPVQDVRLAGAVILNGKVTVNNTLAWSNWGSVTINSDFKGNINGSPRPPTITVGPGVTLTSTIYGGGALEFTNNANTSSTVTGAISSLSSIKLLSTGTVNLNSTVSATNITFGAGGTLNLANNTTSTSGIDFANNAGKVVLAAGKSITGDVNSTVGPNGTLEFTNSANTTSTVTGAIGATNRLALINLLSTGTVNLGSTVAATDIKFGGAATLNLGGDTTVTGGAIDFVNNSGKVVLAAGKTITGAVNSTVGVNGTLEFTNSANTTSAVTGAIGAINRLALINLLSTGTVNLGSTVAATDIKFGGAATLNLGGDTTVTGGAIDFANNAGTVVLTAGKNITGAVSSSTAANGTLKVSGTGNSIINGAIGGGAGLALIDIANKGTTTLGNGNTVSAGEIRVSNAGAVVTADGASYGTVRYTAAGTFTANSTQWGDIDFNNQDGTFNAKAYLDANVYSTGGRNGTLRFIAPGAIHYNIGPIKKVDFAAAGSSTFATIDATTIQISDPGVDVTNAFNVWGGNILFTQPGKVTLSYGVGGSVDFAGTAGTLRFAGAGLWGPGTIDSTIASNGTIEFGVGGGGLTGAIGTTNPIKLISLISASGATLGSTVRATDIIFSPTSTSATILELQGDTTTTNGIDFGGMGGTVFASTNGITINGPISNSTGGPSGTLKFAAGGTVNGAIGGAAAANSLALIDANGTGTVNLGNGNTVRATSITVTKAGAVVTAAGAVTSGVSLTAAGTYNSNGTLIGPVTVGGGGIVNATGASTGDVTFALGAGTYNYNGTLTGNIDYANTAGLVVLADTKSISGTVLSTGGPNGTLRFAGAGSVNNAIGGGGAGAVNLGNGNTVRATSITVTKAGAVVTAAGAVTSGVTLTAAGTYNSVGTLAGNVTLGGGGTVNASSAVTGNVTFATGGGAYNSADLTGNVDFANYAGLVVLADTKSISGTVLSIGGPNGTLRFAGAGTVNSAIGGANAATGLALIDANGVGAVNLGNGNTVRATSITVTKAGAVVTAAGAVTATGGVTLSAAGTYNSNGTLTGPVTVGGGGTFNASSAVTGNVTFAAGGGTYNSSGTLAGNVMLGGGGTVNASSAVTGDVTFAAGGGTYNSANLMGNVDFANVAGVVVLADTKSISGTVDSTGGTNGTLQFTNGGTIGGAIGATNALTLIKLLSTGTVNLNSTVDATNITFNGAATLNLSKNTQANIDFTGNAGTVIIADNAGFGGKLDSTLSTGGTLQLSGKSTIAALIGSSNPLTLVQLNGDGGVGSPKLVTFISLLKTNTLSLPGLKTTAELNSGALIDSLIISNANSDVKIGDARILEFTGNNQTIDLTGNSRNINFNNNGILKFNSKSGALVTATLDAALDPAGAKRGEIILNALGTKSALTITGGSLGVGSNTLQSVSITGDQLVTLNSALSTELLFIDDGAKLLATHASAANSTQTSINNGSSLEYRPSDNMPIGATILNNANSTLQLTASTKDCTFTLNNNIESAGNNLGIVIVNGNGKKAILTASGGGKSIGTKSSTIAELRLIGADVEINKLVDISNVELLTVSQGIVLTSLTRTAFTTPVIKIGEVGANGTIIIDTEGVGSINMLNGNIISFENADSTLKLTNLLGVGNTNLILKDILMPGGGIDLKGNLALEVSNGKTLAITPNALETIGISATKRFGSLTVSGDEAITINPKIFAANITVNNTNSAIFGGAIDTGVGGIINIPTNGAINFQENVNSPSIQSSSTASISFIKDLKVDTLNAPNLSLELANNVTLNAYTSAYVSNILLSYILAHDGTHLAGGNYTLANGLGAGSTITLMDGFNLLGPLVSANKGNFIFSKNGNVSGDFGTSINRLGDVTVGSGGNLQVGGEVYVDKFILTDSTSSVAFIKDNININTGLNITGSGTGEFTQGVQVNAPIISSGTLNFSSNSGNKIIALNNNITANNINFAKSTINVGAPSAINGDTTFTNTTFNLDNTGNNDLTFNGSATFKGNVTVNIDVNKDSKNNAVNSQLIVTPTTKLLLSGADTLKFNITSGTNVKAVKIMTLSQGASNANSKGFNLKNITVDSGSIFRNFESTPSTNENGDLIYKAKNMIFNSNNYLVDLKQQIVVSPDGVVTVPTENISDTFLAKVKKAVTLTGAPLELVLDEITLQLANAPLGTQAAKIREELDFFRSGDELKDGEKLVDALERLENSINQPTSELFDETFKAVVDNISGRLATLMGPTVRAIRVAGSTGISAGEAEAKNGVWVAPIFSDSELKNSNISAGYRAISFGGTFGFDFEVMDKLLVGGAISSVGSKSKYTGKKSGDVAKMESMLYSVYSMYQFTDNIFAHTVGTYCATRIKTKENQGIGRSSIVEGSYVSRSYGVEILGGYDIFVKKQYMITPMIGLDYKHTDGSKYNQKSQNAAQLFKVTKKAHDKLEASLGLKVGFGDYEFGKLTISPEVHGFARKLITNNPIKVGLNSLDNSIYSVHLADSSKQAKNSCNLGFDINANRGMMSFGLGYDLKIAKNFKDHQGSLKIRLNF